MALSEEFGNIADRRTDAATSFSSSEDAARGARDELGGREESLAAAASQFDGRAEAATGELARRADADGIESSRSQDSLMAELVSYAQGSGGREAALAAFSALDRSHAERFLATAAALLGPSEKAAFQAAFDARFKGGPSLKPAAAAAAAAAGDALIGSSDSIAGDAWNAGRAAERAAKTVSALGARRGAAAAVLDAAIESDDESIVKEGTTAARGAKTLYDAGRSVRAAWNGGHGRRADLSAESAKRKSMSIARGFREGRAVDGMRLAGRIKMALSHAGASATGWLGAAAASVAPALASSAGSVAAALAIVFLVVAVFGGGAATAAAPPSLNAVEAQVYTFFSQKGMDDVHIAAIMGNMKGESTMNPAMIEHFRVINDRLGWSDEQLLSYKGSDGCGIGLCQWSFGRRNKLIRLSQSRGSDWRTDVGLQLEYFWDHDIWQGNWGSGQNTKSRFLATDDVDVATRIFLRGWEVAGVERLEERVGYARDYLRRFTSLSGGQDLASATERQKQLVLSCMTTPSPGAGLCAWWVSDVFSRAGLGGVSGNADDMYYSWCSSSNRNELKVGMLVAVPRHGKTSAGRRYGHVGIYIGDGKLMDNIGPIRTIELDEWLSFYGDLETPRWGWANGNDLSRN